jgi:excisionase family DNA binding protein
VIDEFLTVDEIASTLRVTPQGVRNWIDQGSLPAYRLGPAGRRIRVCRKDFDRFLAKGQPGRRGSPRAAVSKSAPTPATGAEPRSVWDGYISPPVRLAR